MLFFKKKEQQAKAKSVSEAINMCFRTIENYDELTFEKWGRSGEEERAIVKHKDKEIFRITRHQRYHRPTHYSIHGFGISEYITSEDSNVDYELDKINSLFKLCESKRWDRHYRKSQTTKQSWFMKIIERIRS